MSIATLKRRMKEYNLKGRHVEYDVDSVREKIRSLLDGPDCMGGNKHTWHTLKMQTFAVMSTNFCRGVVKFLSWCRQSLPWWSQTFAAGSHFVLSRSPNPVFGHLKTKVLA